MNGRRGLGRGLEALIPSNAGEAADSGLREIDGARFEDISVADIRPNARQPRENFDPDEMAELVHSIGEIGLLQPIVVRPVHNETEEAQTPKVQSESDPSGSDQYESAPYESAQYEIIMGERRWRASQEAGLTTIGAIVRETSDDDMLRDALLENLHRSELNPLEEAAAYEQLLDDFGCTHEELAGRIGRSRPQISNTLRLLRLAPAVQRRVAAGVLSAGHARALVAIENAERQESMATRVVAEGLSVRALEELVTVVPGDDTKPTRKTPSITAPRLNDVSARLSECLDTRVKVSLGKTKGKIVVEFATVDDLERIVSLIVPHDGK